MRRLKGSSNFDFFSNLFNGEQHRVVDCATKGGAAYIALEGPGRNGLPAIGALVVLIRWAPNDPDYNFSYKDMTETMGPYQADCPERILEQLSPVEILYGCERDSSCSPSRHAREWRQRCRAQIDKRKARPRVRKGDTVRFAEPWRFTDGREISELIAVDLRRNLFRFAGAGADDGRTVRYKLPRSWRVRDYAVVGKR